MPRNLVSQIFKQFCDVIMGLVLDVSKFGIRMNLLIEESPVSNIQKVSRDEMYLCVDLI